MKDNAIGVGDLVYVARGNTCCGGMSGSEGMLFTVNNLRQSSRLTCNYCCVDRGCTVVVGGLPNGKYIMADRLKKWDPPAQSADRQTEKELVA